MKRKKTKRSTKDLIILILTFPLSLVIAILLLILFVIYWLFGVEDEVNIFYKFKKRHINNTSISSQKREHECTPF